MPSLLVIVPPARQPDLDRLSVTAPCRLFPGPNGFVSVSRPESVSLADILNELTEQLHGDDYVITTIGGVTASVGKLGEAMDAASFAGAYEPAETRQ